MRISTELTRALARGHRSYDTFVGEWWQQKSEDAAHRRAYRTIVEDAAHFLEHTGRRSPRVLVDYACGTGGMLPELARRFPRARLVALDGSRRMLDLALQRMASLRLDAALVPLGRAFAAQGPRIRLVRAPLPCYPAPRHVADAAFFLFPNMNCSRWEKSRIQRISPEDPATVSIARFLSRLPDLDNPEEETSPVKIRNDLLYDRALSRNLHEILRQDGWWFKAEYSVCPRADWSDLDQWRMLFSEAALDVRIEERGQHDLFRHAQDWYHRSRVIMDVFDQTRNPRDRTGGYILSAFRARRLASKKDA